MPTYRYVCTECGEETKIWATFAEQGQGRKVTCPRCGSQKMARVFRNVMVMHKGTKCGPQAGPGCCGGR
jgi:putative FmdB family regulatory protein